MTGTDPRSRGHVTVSTGPDAFTLCHTYADSAPIMAISTGAIDVSVSPLDRSTVTDADAEFANELARAAATYASECARLHAEQTFDAQLATQSGANPCACVAQTP